MRVSTLKALLSTGNNDDKEIMVKIDNFEYRVRSFTGKLESITFNLDGQIPEKASVKPVYVDRTENEFGIYVCGSCGCPVSLNNFKANFCYKCGEEVEWDNYERGVSNE